MAGIQDDNVRSLSFAEAALNQIRSLNQSAIPRNYEIWYVYTAGFNAALNKVINETLSRNGKLSETDLDEIHATYLSHARATDRIDEVGARVLGQIDEVMAMISEGIGVSASFGDSLRGASTNLVSGQQDREQIRSVVEMLVQSTQTMQNNNKALEDRLTNSRQEINCLQQNLEAIRAESLTDPLTGLSNRKHFDRTIEGAITAANDSGEPLSLLMLDIDHFKSFNDNYGHLTGDQVLRLVGMSLKQSIKGADTTARYGGEEFAVVLPNTALRQALTVADNIRRAVMSRELKKKSTGEILGRITVSVGVAAARGSDDMFSLIERADSCLYAAKRTGRNRVICETDPEYISDTSARVA